MKSVSQAISSTDLGYLPQVEGNSLKVSIPKMSNELRQKLSKQAAKVTEQGKVSMRRIRQDALKEVKKEKLPEDIERNLEKKMQTVFDAKVKVLDTMLQSKEKDILK